SYCTWYFNPPRSPHFGGSWERLIRIVKSNLMNIMSVMPERHPDDELLHSVMTEVMNILNSRPLTYLPIESEEEEALTPNHFILGSSNGLKPPIEADSDVMILRKKWKKSQYLADLFWKRWVKEYLPIISRRSKWFVKADPLKVGDVVIIVDDKSPRNTWI